MTQVALMVDVWDSLSGHMAPSAQSEAAEDMVAVLVDVYEMDPTELYEEFFAHRDVRRALKQYLPDDSHTEDHGDDSDEHEYD